jgi:predicted glutamine amidotransferase
MCVIIYKKAGVDISDSMLEGAWKSNSDGFGAMFPKDGELFIMKSHQKETKVLKAIKEKLGDKYKATPIVFHARIKTSGKVNLVNTHPFYIEDSSVGIAHNGILMDFSKLKENAEYSDTYLFVSSILKKMPSGFQNIPAFLYLIEKAAGTSKFAIMDAKGTVKLINENGGWWIQDNKVWVSNKSYEWPRYEYKSSSIETPSSGRSNLVNYTTSETMNAYQLNSYLNTTKKHCLKCGMTLIGYSERNDVYCSHCDLLDGFIRQFGRPELPEVTTIHTEA